MKLTETTTIRLSAEKQRLYEAEAAARNIPLRTYLRQRLEIEDNTLTEVAALRKSIGVRQSSDADSNKDRVIYLEILLLLRQIVPPNKVQMAQAELKRLGLNIWQGENDD